MKDTTTSSNNPSGCGACAPRFLRTQNPPRLLLAGLAVAAAALAPLGAKAQTTTTLAPMAPKISVGANVSATYKNYTLKATLSGGTDPVELSVLGAPAGVTPQFSTNGIGGTYYDKVTLTGTTTTFLSLTVANAAKGLYPLTIQASNTVSLETSTTNVLLIVADLWTNKAPSSGNWSVDANWSTGHPADNDDVKFEASNLSTVNSSVSLASLGYLTSSSGQNITNTIPAGVTLSVLGTNGFYAGQDYTNGAASRSLNLYLTGAGMLNVSNTAANFAFVPYGDAGSTQSKLDMSGLNTANIYVSRAGLGDSSFAQVGGSGSAISTVSLAKTNIIYAASTSDYSGAGFLTPAISFFNNNNVNSGSPSTGNLGVTNAFLGESFFVHQNCSGSSSSILRFNPSFLSQGPTAYFRGTDGGRMQLFAMDIQAGTSGVSPRTRGDVNFSGGTVDMLVDTIWVARNSTNVTSANQQSGTLTLTAGKIDANTIRLGYHAYTTTGGNYCQGTLNVYGPQSRVQVNSELNLGFMAGDAAPTDGSDQTYGRINIQTNAIICASTVTSGPWSTNNQISLTTGGTLEITNFAGTSTAPLPLLSMNNGALTLHGPDGVSPKVYVQNLVLSGSVSVINLADLPTFTSYPQQLPLISYGTVVSPTSLGKGTLPAGVQGVIVNNTANHTIDMLITTNAPKSLLWRGTVSANWNTSEANWQDLQTGTMTTFANGDFVRFDDTAAQTSIVVTESLYPGQSASIPGVTMTNSTRAYSFSGTGSLNGGAAFIKAGTGELQVNVYTEGTYEIVQGTLSGTGTLGSALVDAGATANFAGTVIGNVVCAGAATLGGTVNGVLTVQTGAAVTNTGTLNGNLSLQSGALLNNQGTMSNIGTPTTGANSTFLNSGTLTGSGLTIGGTFKDMGGAGSITLANSLTINGTGLFIPGGDGIGATTVLGTGSGTAPGRVLFQTGSTNVFKVNPGTGDRTVVNCYYLSLGPNQSTVATNGGMLKIVNVGSVGFSAGQTFMLFKSSTPYPPANGAPYDAGLNTTNSYPIIDPPTPGPGLVWDMSNLIHGGVLGVALAPYKTLVWKGTVDGTWNTTKANWLDLFTSLATNFAAGDALQFDDSGSNPTIALEGSLAPGGSVLVTNNLVNYSFSGAGSIDGGASLNKLGSGTLVLGGANTYSGGTTINAGSLLVNNTTNSATGSGAVTVASGATLGGNGAIAGTVTVQSGGILAPGSSIGTLTLTNTVTISGKVLMELNRANAGATNDAIVGTNITASSGTLVVTNIGPGLYNGDRFKLFSGAVTFKTVTLPATDPTGTNAYTWNNNLTVDGSIQLASGGLNVVTVNTTATNIVSERSGNTLTMSWPADHIGWQLQSNSVSLSATNMWFPVTGAESTNQVILTVDPAKPSVFYRLAYPLP